MKLTPKRVNIHTTFTIAGPPHRPLIKDRGKIHPPARICRLGQRLKGKKKELIHGGNKRKEKHRKKKQTPQSTHGASPPSERERAGERPRKKEKTRTNQGREKVKRAWRPLDHSGLLQYPRACSVRSQQPKKKGNPPMPPSLGRRIDGWKSSDSPSDLRVPAPVRDYGISRPGCFSIARVRTLGWNLPGNTMAHQTAH